MATLKRTILKKKTLKKDNSKNEEFEKGQI